jgi:hypothetical protein
MRRKSGRLKKKKTKRKGNGTEKEVELALTPACPGVEPGSTKDGV